MTLTRRRFPRPRSILRTSLGALALTMLVSQARATDVEVMLDHAMVLKTPDRAQSLVLGNPAIADVTPQKNGTFVLTGKSFGMTNLIAVDGAGLPIVELKIVVRPTAGQGRITVLKGVEQETYVCNPTCNPAITLGDGDRFFTRAGNQAQARNGFAGAGPK